MADPEQGLPAEAPAETGTPPEPTDNPPAANEPDVTPKPEAKPAPKGEEPAKPSLNDFSIDDLLERSDIKEHLDKIAQSAGDRAAARAETRFEEKAERAREVAQANTDAAERQKLVASEDYDEIGRQEVAKSEASARLLESLAQAGEAIAQETVGRYTKELGEEAVDRIIAETNEAGGDQVTLARALADEAHTRVSDKRMEAAIVAAEKRFDEKLEAAHLNERVQERSQEAENTGPVEKVSGTPPVQKSSEEPDTWETMVDKFNAGDITWEEMEPFQKEHEKATGSGPMRN